MRTEESKAATRRYVEAMRDIIKRNQDNGGRIINASAFAESIAHSIQNINKLTTGVQDVTPDLLIRSAKLYGINPNYVLLGIGGMFLNEVIAPTIKQQIQPKGFRYKRRPSQLKQKSPFKPLKNLLKVRR